MKIHVEVTSLAHGIWLSVLTPREIRALGTDREGACARSVISVRHAHFDSPTATLSFKLEDAAVLNVGTCNNAIILDRDYGTLSDNELEIEKELGVKIWQHEWRPGDFEFLSEVEKMLPELDDSANKLLLEIRRHFRGELTKKKSGRYVETPDNFWTVKVQHRDRSLAFTVRGRPELFTASALKIVDDQAGYSRFKVKHPGELESALAVILAATRRRGS